MDQQEKSPLSLVVRQVLSRGTVEAYVARGAKVAIFDMNEANANAVIAELGADKVAFLEGQRR